MNILHNRTSATKRKDVKPLLAAAVVATIALTGGGCTSSTGEDEKLTDAQLQKYQANQPVPMYEWSQYRQSVIDITAAQVNGVATTSFFFLEGVDKPVGSCPSIGFPVPSTAQLTNPEQVIHSGTTIAQAEPNGVYTGDSTATYVICVAPDGTTYADYWEGYVRSVGGPAEWDTMNQEIVLTGDPTVVANTK